MEVNLPSNDAYVGGDANMEVILGKNKWVVAMKATRKKSHGTNNEVDNIRTRAPQDVEVGVQEYEACKNREVKAQTCHFEFGKSDACVKFRETDRVNKDVTQIATKTTIKTRRTCQNHRLIGKTKANFTRIVPNNTFGVYNMR